MEPIRHCDDLWIDARHGVRWFQSCPWFPPKDTKYFSNLATSRIIFYLVFFLLVITIPNHSGSYDTRTKSWATCDTNLDTDELDRSHNDSIL